MIVDSREYILKNGQKITLRSPQESDAEQLVQHRYLTSKGRNVSRRSADGVYNQTWDKLKRRVYLIHKEREDAFYILPTLWV